MSEPKLIFTPSEPDGEAMRGRGPQIRVLRDSGRIEPFDADTDEALLKRAVDCFNACDGLSDTTMQMFAASGEQILRTGNLLERTIAFTLLFNHDKRTALQLLEAARAEIEKLKGPPA